MTKSLADIMSDKWEEPPEIKAIKNYVSERYKENIAVSVGSGQIKIHAPSSALAATLRLDIEDLKQAINTDKRLVILVG